MKRLMVVIAMFFYVDIIAQNNIDSIYKGNFKWESIDTINKTKDEIYTLSKVFISSMFNEPDRVIKVDDKESGIIIIKGKLTIMGIAGWFITGGDYYYNFTLSLYIKDNKYKIIIEDVNYDKTILSYKIYNNKIQPFENGNYPSIINNAKLDKKHLDIMMSELKMKLASIIISYSKDVRKIANTKDDW